MWTPSSSTPSSAFAVRAPAPGAAARTPCFHLRGCGGTEVRETVLEAEGPRHDRRFMIVNRKGAFQTQRQIPKMATIRPALETQGAVVTGLVLATSDTPDRLHVDVVQDTPVDTLAPEDGSSVQGARVEVRIWGQRVPGAVDQGPQAAEWLERVLDTPGLRLVFMDAQCHRALQHKSGKYAEPFSQRVGTPTGVTSFADGYPLLVANRASLADLNDKLVAAAGTATAALPMERFRANIVVAGPTQAWEEDTWLAFRVGPVQMHGVKRCVRCRVPTTDQETGVQAEGVGGREAEPLATLRETRQGAKPHEGCFGMNAIHEMVQSEAGCTVRVGDVVVVNKRGRVGPLPPPKA